MASQRDSLAELEAQLLVWKNLDESTVSCFGLEEDAVDDAGCSSDEDNQDEDEDFSNAEMDGDDEESVVTTASQAYKKLSQTRVNATALLVTEKARLRDPLHVTKPFAKRDSLLIKENDGSKRRVENTR